MIAFGKNPWALQDALAIKATALRAAAYSAGISSPPSWDAALSGTVSYPFVPLTGTPLTEPATLPP